MQQVLAHIGDQSVGKSVAVPVQPFDEGVVEHASQTDDRAGGRIGSLDIAYLFRLHSGGSQTLHESLDCWLIGFLIRRQYRRLTSVYHQVCVPAYLTDLRQTWNGNATLSGNANVVRLEHAQYLELRKYGMSTSAFRYSLHRTKSQCMYRHRLPAMLDPLVDGELSSFGKHCVEVALPIGVGFDDVSRGVVAFTTLVKPHALNRARFDKAKCKRTLSRRTNLECSRRADVAVYKQLFRTGHYIGADLQICSERNICRLGTMTDNNPTENHQCRQVVSHHHDLPLRAAHIPCGPAITQAIFRLAQYNTT